MVPPLEADSIAIPNKGCIASCPDITDSVGE